LIGTKLWKWPVRITGFNVCYDAPYFKNRISGLIERTLAAYRLKVKINPDELDIRDGYVGAGYARSRTEELALIHEVARQTGVILDPTYTGKAMFGLLDQLQKGKISNREKIIFLHTGGLFGLFPLRDKIPGI
jgi:D-cysteine desulfhydrase